MESGIDNPDRTGMWDQRRLRTRLECRQCGVICERVVSPWRCLKSRHGCIYAYEQGETTYFGCLHKVFAPELDLEAFGEGRSGGGATLMGRYGLRAHLVRNARSVSSVRTTVSGSAWTASIPHSSAGPADYPEAV
jgi:hypothetical protein